MVYQSNIPQNTYAKQPAGRVPYAWPARSTAQMPRSATAQVPAKIPVQTIPIRASAAVQAINNAAPSADEYYPPEIRALFANAQNNGPIGGNLPMTQPNATTGRIGDMVRGQNKPFLSGDPGQVDWNAVAPDDLPPGGYGVAGLANAVGAGGGAVPPAISQALQPPKPKMFEGPKAMGNQNYVEQAKSTSSLSSNGPGYATPEQLADAKIKIAAINARKGLNKPVMLRGR